MTRYIHIPTKKVYTSNGASGIVNEYGDTPLPIWLTENSDDWLKVDKEVEIISPEIIETLIKLGAVRKENRKLLIERGWGDLTDDEFSFYFKYLKDNDYFKTYTPKKIKHAYAEFQKNQKLSNKS